MTCSMRLGHALWLVFHTGYKLWQLLNFRLSIVLGVYSLDVTSGWRVKMTSQLCWLTPTPDQKISLVGKEPAAFVKWHAAPVAFLHGCIACCLGYTALVLVVACFVAWHDTADSWCGIVVHSCKGSWSWFDSRCWHSCEQFAVHLHCILLCIYESWQA